MLDELDKPAQVALITGAVIGGGLAAATGGYWMWKRGFFGARSGYNDLSSPLQACKNHTNEQIRIYGEKFTEISQVYQTQANKVSDLLAASPKRLDSDQQESLLAWQSASGALLKHMNDKIIVPEYFSDAGAAEQCLASISEYLVRLEQLSQQVSAAYQSLSQLLGPARSPSTLTL